MKQDNISERKTADPHFMAIADQADYEALLKETIEKISRTKELLSETRDLLNR